MTFNLNAQPISAHTEVVKLAPVREEAAINVLTHAFAADPLMHYFSPDNEQVRLRNLHWMADVLLRYAQPYDQGYTTPGNPKGVALWIPPGHYPLDNWRFLRSGVYALPWKIRLQRLWQFLSLFHKAEEYHEQDMSQPHWYLFMLGVAPAYQGQGIGSQLLQPVLAQADRERIPCYLETSTEGAVRFYQRHGFEILRTAEVGADGPRYRTMKRNPQGVES